MPKVIPMIGKRFGRLTVIAEGEKRTGAGKQGGFVGVIAEP